MTERTHVLVFPHLLTLTHIDVGLNLKEHQQLLQDTFDTFIVQHLSKFDLGSVHNKYLMKTQESLERI